MTFVCLWTPSSPTGAGASADGALTDAARADLTVALLAVAPRVLAEERRGIVWADARGLPARGTAERLLAVLREHAAGAARPASPRAGVAMTPVAAEIAARHGAGPVTEVRPDGDRDFLALYPVAVLEPPEPLRNALDAAGIALCRDLAALDQGAVEVRLGAEGVRLWRMARADDRRRLFAPLPRALPSASMDWVDYALKDPERLVFVVNALAERVCTELDARGVGARAVTLVFSLASRQTIEHPLRVARPTASRMTWMRRARTALDRLTLPDAVTGITLRVDSAAESGGKQGDLFDRGFGTARAAEEALARLIDDQGAVVVAPENGAHSLLERRTRWVAEDSSAAIGRGVAHGAGAERPPAPRLSLYLLPEPRHIAVATAARRDVHVPTRYQDYQDGGTWRGIVLAAGPDRVSGDRWEAAYAREYFRCVTEAGGLVWLFRDGCDGEWYLHGWWD